MVVFDVGTAIDVADGKLRSVRGQVIRLIPGRNLCHACAGFFDANQVQQGLLSDADYEAERARGYVKGADIAAPSVMPVNTFLAGACVWEMLRYLSGATAGHCPDIVSFDLLLNESKAHFYERNADGQRASCATCSPDGYLFGGDSAPLLTRQLISRSERLAEILESKGRGSDGPANPTE